MPITDKFVFGKLEILEDGTIQVRRDRVILDIDGSEIQRTYFRYVLVPGQDVANQPQKIQALCNFVWTPAVIAAYQAKLAAIIKPL